MSGKSSSEKNPTPNPKVPGVKEAERVALDEELDEALEETFPASDPIAVDPPSKQR